MTTGRNLITMTTIPLLASDYELNILKSFDLEKFAAEMRYGRRLTFTGTAGNNEGIFPPTETHTWELCQP